ncbi:hypothetical protein, partial [Stenotrophomonas maltophilia]|uniref:hypothetical protein n=1 Tax=Stenotrophomonas maltophilia TaxID=40324 RepID=UPI001954DA8C
VDSHVAQARQLGLLDLVEEAGEFGISIQDLQTGTARWSKGLFHLFGLDPQPHPHPQSLDRLEALLHPSDRAAFRTAQI